MMENRGRLEWEFSRLMAGEDVDVVFFSVDGSFGNSDLHVSLSA